MTELKRRHHYVWQYYLAAWAREDVVACLRDSKVFETGTTNLAVETDFYRLTELTTGEQEFVGRLAMATPDPLMKELNAGWFAIFLAPFKLREIARAANIRPDLLEQFDVVTANLEEDLHSKIEERAISHIDELRSGRMAFLNSIEHRTTFLHFLAVQYLRTRKILDAMGYALSTAGGVRTDRVWGVLRHCFATNIGVSLSRHWEQTEVSLLRAPQHSEFITSDQPVVNLHAKDKALDESVDKLACSIPCHRISLFVGILQRVRNVFKPSRSRRMNWTTLTRSCSRWRMNRSLRRILRYCASCSLAIRSAYGCGLPNTRLKLAALGICGSLLFVNVLVRRRSLGAPR